MTNTSTLTDSLFAREVHAGLTSTPKTLPSKYFYDERGDELFQTIMSLGEYYLTRSEFEIFAEQKDKILDAFIGETSGFKLIELGAGDGTKTKVLLEHFVKSDVNFSYAPIDISQNVLDQLTSDLEENLPQLKLEPIQGDYFKALASLNKQHTCREIVLFLGSNIGNFSPIESIDFLSHLGENLSSGDMLLIGFDLMKDPQAILNAYNDKMGVTKEFNLNLLTRINNELGGDFDTSKFEHFPTYDPITGETKSHLVSTVKQNVYIEELDQVYSFDAWEAIHTEVSQKYSFKMIEEFAAKAGFRIKKNFLDSNEYYVDSLWEKV